ncbi:type II toxin-antitoxin system Phd/YefM family antitoxin [Piscirickettsia salmonis]|uniref:type II toxin-antitoxin system Phd/YefM family antitoxin n=1 Tax=Piscirickettsia salmonis TaxID=1238 RepID=UPI003EBF1945
MKQLYAQQSVTITELRKSPTSVINEANGEPVVILNHNVPAAYMVPPELFEAMLDSYADRELENIVKKRLSSPDRDFIDVDVDDL